MKPRVAITMGEPAGVGPEVVARALADRRVWEVCAPIVIGHRRLLEQAAKAQSLEVRFVDELRPRAAAGPDDVPVLLGELFDPALVTPGKPTPETGRAVIRWIEEAVRLARGGEVEAMATGPIDKAVLSRAGFGFPGHTEFLGALCETPRPVMMLASPRLRVVLATIHIPLSAVPGQLEAADLPGLLRITDAALRRDFALSRPRIAVAALNPHGGEGGMFGDEEERLIRPAVEGARRAGIDAVGPLPADTLFFHAREGAWDAVVCMYHDQGLIPLKMDGFMEGVNVTLGLPIVRTSVDHGTAYDLAGTGRADPESLVAALRMAAEVATNRARIAKNS
ncbi:MAG: 4-hydroxythreonine-4-phosphate dehydrogenase PdxA [Deltaproteobacteria bacterium]|nr:4-hydroxythreonine-4-phosphate dehydrogenase PdxA [Deltaproteobacteria bacterium]